MSQVTKRESVWVALSLSILAVAGAGAERVDSAPQLRAVEVVAPAYPMLALYAGAEGEALVLVSVDKTGAVAEVRAVEGVRPLRAAAEEAARLWRFEASDSGGEITAVFSFKIMPKGTTEADLATRFLPPYEVEVRRSVPEVLPHVDPVLDARD